MLHSLWKNNTQHYVILNNTYTEHQVCNCGLAFIFQHMDRRKQAYSATKANGSQQGYWETLGHVLWPSVFGWWLQSTSESLRLWEVPEKADETSACRARVGLNDFLRSLPVSMLLQPDLHRIHFSLLSLLAFSTYLWMSPSWWMPA